MRVVTSPPPLLPIPAKAFSISSIHDSAKRTLDWWEAHPEYNLTLRFIVVYPGTYLYHHAIKHGIIKDPVEFLKAGCPQINVSKLSDEELSYVAKRLIRTAQKGVNINNRKTISIDENGRLTMSGICSVCGTKNEWSNIKTFANNNWCRCVHCNRRLVVDLPEDLKCRFLSNASLITSFCKEKQTKVAFWGITSRTIDFFENSEVFLNDSTLFVDTSFAKRHIKINGRNVEAPERLAQGDVSFVVCCYPNRMETVKRLCPSTIKKFFFAHELLLDNFHCRFNNFIFYPSEE